MKKISSSAMVLVLLGVIAVCGAEQGLSASSSIPRLINYQGVLATPAGTPVEDGTYDILFSIYDAGQGGNLEWDHTYSVTVTKGLFNVILGESEPIDLPFDEDYWLEIKVGNDPPLSPRIRITSVGYAYRAEVANTAVVAGSGGGWVDDGSVVRLTTTTDKVGIGTTNPEANLHITRSIKGQGLRFEIIPQEYQDITFYSSGDRDWVIRHHGRDYDPGGGSLVFWSPTPRDLGFVVRNVGIGTTTPPRKLTVRGNILVQSANTGAAVMELGEGLDYAEGFDVSDQEEVTPGAVLVIDQRNPGKLSLSTRPYDSKVAGIVAGGKGLGSAVRVGVGHFDFDVALAGRVYCNVDATEAGVKPGDLLTTSATPGYAMKVTDRFRAHGAILGKAMEELEKGQRGQIMVLVTLQ